MKRSTTCGQKRQSGMACGGCEQQREVYERVKETGVAYNDGSGQTQTK